jgi:acetate kinase
VAGLILVLNSGSSSLKASLVDDGSEQGTVAESANWTGERSATFEEVMRALDIDQRDIQAVAHRVVHGGARFTSPVVIDDEVLAEIEAIAELAPLHNVIALELMKLGRSRLPHVRHVACFDTAFHATLPEVAWRYPVPHEWPERFGVRRFGFHGLSVQWSSWKSSELLGRPIAAASIVVAHLGSGCSITAVENGLSKWTSMGFTPLEGIMMGTRSGSIDPGVVIHMLQPGRATLAELADVLERKSGLLGVSGVSADLREVRAAANAGNTRAALAIDMFAASAAEGIAAAMTWVAPDAIVFTGGIGEHDHEMQSEILARLHAGAQSLPVLTITAREDVVMAREATRLLELA